MFDHTGSLTSITNSSVIAGVTTTLSSYSYGLDASSRRTSCTEYSGDVVSWGYDWGGRLTSESRTGSSAYSTTYTLDGEGRRTSQAVTVGGSTATTAFSLNTDDELTSTSSSTGGFTNSYSYSDNGEQIGRTLSGTTYSADFDYDGQMTSITQGSSIVSYATDAIGRRVSRTAGGTTTNFQYSGDSVLLEKQGSTTSATYTYGNALVRKDGETPLYDGLGTARSETNSSQAVTFTLIPDAFGNAVTTTGSTGSSYDFAATSGYRTDGDAGLMKVGARYYDPQVGSFTTRDTYLDQKPYLYCEHDPVNAVDPDGHIPEWLKKLIRIWVIGHSRTEEPQPSTIGEPLPPGHEAPPPPGWTPGGPPAPSGPGWKIIIKGVIEEGGKMLEPFQWIIIPPEMQKINNPSGGRMS